MDLCPDCPSLPHMNPHAKTDGGIVVWRFHDAPTEYQGLSDHGGDEDWLAFVPEALSEEWIGWMTEGTSFGCCSVSEHRVAGGVVRIGAHS